MPIVSAVIFTYPRSDPSFIWLNAGRGDLVRKKMRRQAVQPQAAGCTCARKPGGRAQAKASGYRPHGVRQLCMFFPRRPSVMAWRDRRRSGRHPTCRMTRHLPALGPVAPLRTVRRPTPQEPLLICRCTPWPEWPKWGQPLGANFWIPADKWALESNEGIDLDMDCIPEAASLAV